MNPKTDFPKRGLGSLGLFLGILLLAGCSLTPRILIFSDPYGKEAFPGMENSAQRAAGDLGVTVVWINLPAQAEVPVFQGFAAAEPSGAGILVPDLYEPAVKEALMAEGRNVVLWGYGEPAQPGPSAGWDRVPALEKLTDEVILEAQLLNREKPILFTAILGPDGTSVREESFLRTHWAGSFGPDRLWIYRVSNTLDRGLALQAAGAVLGQNVETVFVDAGRMSSEISRSLLTGNLRLAVVDWLPLGLDQKKVRFSLERDWTLYWKTVMSALLEGKEAPVAVPMTLHKHFSQENSLLKSFHIR